MAPPWESAFLNWISLSADEFRRVRLLALGYALLLAALYVLKPLRNAVFLDELGVGRLPWVLLAVALVGALLSSFFARRAVRVSIGRLVPRLLFGGALFFAVAREILARTASWSAFAFYVAVSLFGQLATACVWLWANGRFGPREARRAFAFIAAFGILGAFVGGGLTYHLASRLGSLNLLWLAALMTACSAFVLRSAAAPQRQQLLHREPAPGLLVDLKQSSLVRRLAAATVVAAAVSALVDLQFNAVVDRNLTSQDQKAAFFGGFFALLNAGAFLFQLLLSSRVLARLGIGGALLSLPVALSVGSAAILAWPSLGSAMFVKSADVGLRHSLYRSVVEVLFVPLPAALRKRARVFLDATLDNLGTGLGAALGLVLLTTSTDGLLSVSVGTLAALFVWFWVALWLRPAYLNALRDGLERRQIHPDELHVQTNDRVQRTALVASLTSDSLRQVNYALEVLAKTRAAELVEPLSRLLSHGDAEIRVKALRLLAVQRGLAVVRLAQSALEDPEAGVRKEALRILATHAAEPLAVLRSYLEQQDPLRWQVALGCLAEQGTFGLPLLSKQLIQRIRELEHPLAPEVRAALVHALSAFVADDATTNILSLAAQGEPVVVRAAIVALGATRDAAHLPWLFAKLDDRRYRAVAASVLAGYGVALINELRERLVTGTRLQRETLSRLLRQMNTEAAARCLFDVAVELPPPARGPLLAACVQLSSSQKTMRFPEAKLAALLDSEVHFQERLDEAVRAIDPTESDAAALLARALKEKRDESTARLLHCLAHKHRAQDVERVATGLRSKNKRTRSGALELLSEILEPRDRDLILPLLESTPEALRRTNNGTARSNASPEAPWLWLLVQDDAWLKACALFAGVQHASEPWVRAVAKLSNSDEPIVREAAQWAHARLDARTDHKPTTNPT